MRGDALRSRYLGFLARQRLRGLTDRSRPLVDVRTIVQQVSRFMRGWAASRLGDHFRFGNPARTFDKITPRAVNRLARLVAKRHVPAGTTTWKQLPANHLTASG